MVWVQVFLKHLTDDYRSVARQGSVQRTKLTMLQSLDYSVGIWYHLGSRRVGFARLGPIGLVSSWQAAGNCKADQRSCHAALNGRSEVVPSSAALPCSDIVDRKRRWSCRHTCRKTACKFRDGSRHSFTDQGAGNPFEDNPTNPRDCDLQRLLAEAL